MVGTCFRVEIACETVLGALNARFGHLKGKIDHHCV